jgi:hypothetical protein
MSLKDITDHIYGRKNVIERTDRPNFFIKELQIYMKYLNDKLEEAKNSFNKKQEKYLITFTDNMKKGVFYYTNLFKSFKQEFSNNKFEVLQELLSSEQQLNLISLEIKQLKNSFKS